MSAPARSATAPGAPVILLAHGWGFGPDLWNGVRAALPYDTLVADLGFFGAPAMPCPPAARPVVAVGHSFGGLWLLRERPVAWDALALVNGFPRFTEGDGFAPATPRRLLDRMITRFGAAPDAVTADFRHRCGSDAPPPAGLDAARLGEGLRALRDWDARDGLGDGPDGALTVLAGDADPIVPPAMTEAAFAGHPIDWCAGGGHLLPLTHPDWCAARIAAVAASLGGPS